jgi:small subunit ribosomal protein S18
MKTRDRERDRDTDAGDDSRKRAMSKKRICRFCADFKMPLDYKEPKLLTVFVTDRGKIIPRRITGNCAFHQRRVQEAVKRARVLALLPFTTIYQS